MRNYWKWIGRRSWFYYFMSCTQLLMLVRAGQVQGVWLWTAIIFSSLLIQLLYFDYFIYPVYRALEFLRLEQKEQDKDEEDE